MFHRIFLISLIALAQTTFAKPSDPLPEGWKQPAALKKSGCDREKSDLYRTEGDFDGDGKNDVARLLAEAKTKRLGLWVWLSSKPQPILVEKTKQQDGGHDAGLGTVPPGEYPTVCGKGYRECEKGEPAKLKLAHPAIDFFTCESANSYLHWSAAKDAFERTWISD